LEVRTPITDAFRAAMKTPQGKATDWHNAPDAPFTTDAVTAGIVPATSKIDGTGDELVVDPAQTNAFRLINRAFANGGTVRMDAARGTPRYVISGARPQQIDEWIKDLNISGTRRAATAASKALPAVRSRIGIFTRPGGSMDEGWTEWLL